MELGPVRRIYQATASILSRANLYLIAPKQIIIFLITYKLQPVFLIKIG